MIMKKSVLTAVLSSLAVSALMALDSPPVGSAAPDFSAPDSKGKTQSLSQ